MSYYPLTMSQAADIVDLSIQHIFSNGSNPAARYGSSREYEAYNRSRLEKYQREDFRYAVMNWTLGIALMGCIIALITQL